MDPVKAVRLLGGVAEARDLERAGVRRRDLASAVADGRLLRVRRGCYATRHADPVRLAEVAWRGDATCLTALRALDLPVPGEASRIHLMRSPARSESGRNLSTPDSVAWHTSGPPRSSLGRAATALDIAARCLDPLDQLVAIDAALHRRMLLPHDLPRFTATPASRRRWLIRHADARTESPAETHARVAFRAARLPFDFQVELDGIGRVDFVVDDRLQVEVDGKDYHSDARQFVRDRRRDRAAVRAGLVPLRYAGWEAIWHKEQVVAEVWEIARLMRGDDATRARVRKSRLDRT